MQGLAGAEALRALADVVDDLSKDRPDLAQSIERAREALRLSTEGQDVTSNAISLLEERIAEGKKTNQTLLEMLHAQRAWTAGVLETVRSTLNQTDLASLLHEG